MALQTQRPIRKDQILSFDEMKKNFIYTAVNDNYGCSCFRLLSDEPYPDYKDWLRMDIGSSWGSTIGRFLSDAGLEQYGPSGKWNGVNYVRKPTMKELFDFIKAESRSMSKKIKL